METLKSSGFSGKKYPLYLSDNYDCLDLLAKIPQSYNKFIVFDKKIKKLYPDFLKSLEGENVYSFSIEALEQNKSFEKLEDFFRKIFKLTPSRDDIFIIVGGGLTLNFGGLAASLVMRGMKFIYVPTTLTAQIDVCIGSKLAVNFSGAKNWIGMYNDPLFCYINPTYFLPSLGLKEFKSQLVEAFKLSLTMDKKLFRYSFENLDKILNFDSAILYDFVKKMLLLKIQIIKEDLLEENLGMSMLYGHTIGHAIEMLSRGKLNHGEAIALGMLCEVRIAQKIKICDDELVQVHDDIVSRLGVIRKIPSFISIEDVMEMLKHNKKNYYGQPRFIFLEDVGKMAVDTRNIFYKTVPEAVLKDCIRSMC